MKKIYKIILWIAFFPFLLTYWGWRNKKKPVMAIGAVLSVLVIVIGVTGQEPGDASPVVDNSTISSQNIVDVTPSDTTEFSTELTTNDSTNVISTVESSEQNGSNESASSLFDGYKLIVVDGGDTSGHREANVVVDIGFGERVYWAFTNEHGQLVKVIADEIILQDEIKENLTSEGRYYPDEAKVPGTELSGYDEGHVIADSLGGVANAYNITPQDSNLNRYGDQAYLEKVIRDAGGCTNFVAVITYPNSNTQIPSHYSFTYTLLGNVVNDEFDNVNPDDVNTNTNTATVPGDTNNSSNLGIEISSLDKKAELIIIKNNGDKAVDLSGWKIRSVTGDQYFTFSSFSLNPGALVKVGDTSLNPDANFHWLEGRGVWNNSSSDSAELYNNSGELIDSFAD